MAIVFFRSTQNYICFPELEQATYCFNLPFRPGEAESVRDGNDGSSLELSPQPPEELLQKKVCRKLF